MNQIWRRKFLYLSMVFAILYIVLPVNSQEFDDEFSTFQEPMLEQNQTESLQAEQGQTELQPAEKQQTDLFPSEQTQVDQPTDQPLDFPSENVQYTEPQNSYSDHSLAGPVSVEKASDIALPYKQRRKTHGVLFSIMYEDFYPAEYISVIDQTHIDGFLDGNSAKLIGVEIGYKYNFSLGSFGFLFQYAKGDSTGNKLGYDRTLDIEKMSASVNYAADMLMKEPYIVPYIQGSISNFDIREDDQNFEGAHSAHMVMGYRIGLLFQLDWIERSIDPRTHEQGLVGSGLQNTYLDVYMSNYMQPSNVYDSTANPEGDANVFAEAQLGLGLKMEF